MPADKADFLSLIVKAEEAAKEAGSEGGDAAAEERAVDVLKLLGKQDVTVALLAETQGGKRLKKLSKTGVASVDAAAKEVVAAWKAAVASAAGAGGAASSPKVAASTPKAEAAKESTAAETISFQDDGTGDGVIEEGSGGKPKAIPLPFDATDDKSRLKIRTVLKMALELAVPDVDGGNPANVAAAVESAMARALGAGTPEYKGKARSLMFNFKDPSNPDLRRRVLAGMLDPDHLVELDSEALASDAKRKENARVRDDMAAEAVRGLAKVAVSSEFKCGKCKQRKCTYFQMQTRSADEPMTTFVTCTVCGNRWKFC